MLIVFCCQSLHFAVCVCVLAGDPCQNVGTRRGNGEEMAKWESIPQRATQMGGEEGRKVLKRESAIEFESRISFSSLLSRSRSIQDVRVA